MLLQLETNMLGALSLISFCSFMNLSLIHFPETGYHAKFYYSKSEDVGASREQVEF